MTPPLITVRVMTAVTPEIIGTLLPAVGIGPSAELSARTRRIAAAATTVSGHQDGRLVAAACVEIEGSRGRLTAIGVSPDHRRRGCGRSLVVALPALLCLDVLTAETDADAVDFYRALGFTVTSLGEQYPGVERFHCHLEAGIGADQRTELTAPPASQHGVTGEEEG